MKKYRSREWLVEFGFIVTADDPETARRKAKKNLKPAKQRNVVDEYHCRRYNEHSL